MTTPVHKHEVETKERTLLVAVSASFIQARIRKDAEQEIIIKNANDFMRRCSHKQNVAGHFTMSARVCSRGVEYSASNDERPAEVGLSHWKLDGKFTISH